MNTGPKTRVLFLCTGNTARSQMAEAMLRRYAGDHFEVHSAGLSPSAVNPYTIRVMEEAGYNLGDHYSKDVTDYLGQAPFEYLITVCAHAEANCPTAFLGVSHRLHWAFDDPAAAEGSPEEKLVAFRHVRDQIQARIQEWLAELAVGQ